MYKSVCICDFHMVIWPLGSESSFHYTNDHQRNQHNSNPTFSRHDLLVDITKQRTNEGCGLGLCWEHSIDHVWQHIICCLLRGGRRSRTVCYMEVSTSLVCTLGVTGWVGFPMTWLSSRCPHLSLYSVLACRSAHPHVNLNYRDWK